MLSVVMPVFKEGDAVEPPCTMTLSCVIVCSTVADVLLEFGADPNRGSDWWAGSFHPLYGASPRIAERLLAHTE